MNESFVRRRLFYRATDYFLDYYGMNNGPGSTLSRLLEGAKDTERCYQLLDQQHRDYVRGIRELGELADGLGCQPGEPISKYNNELRQQLPKLCSVYNEQSNDWLLDYAVCIMRSDELLEAICSEAQKLLDTE